VPLSPHIFLQLFSPAIITWSGVYVMFGKQYNKLRIRHVSIDLTNWGVLAYFLVIHFATLYEIPYRKRSDYEEKLHHLVKMLSISLKSTKNGKFLGCFFSLLFILFRGSINLWAQSKICIWEILLLATKEPARHVRRQCDREGKTKKETERVRNVNITKMPSQRLHHVAKKRTEFVRVR